MYSYIIGKVEEIESNYITIDNNEIGYLIYTSNPYSFNLNQEYKIYLKKFPKIGDKVARQIILDLKGKLISKEQVIKTNDELIEALKALGYKTVDINKILPNITETAIENQIKEALKLLLK